MAAAIPLAGAGISAIGDVQQGKLTSDTLNNQADNLMAQGQEAEAKGKYDAMREQIVSGQKIGTSVASYGAAGVAANSGSVLDVVGASHENAELDRLNILHGADIRAINYQNQASMDRFGGAAALQGSYWKALGALTLGAVKVGEAGSGATSSGGGGEGAGDDEEAAGGATMAGSDTGEAAAMMA